MSAGSRHATLVSELPPAALAPSSPRPGRPAHAARRLQPWLERLLLGAALPFTFFVWWWWSAEANGLNTEIYASPRILYDLFVSLWSDGLLQEHGLVSLQRALVGFVIGSTIGIMLGIICGYVQPAEKLLDPSLQIFRALPTVALLPIFLIWFGFGEFSKILLIVLGIIPRTYVITYGGVTNVDKKLLEVAKVYNLSRLQSVVHVIVPAAAPYIFNALRLASVSALLMLIFAEAINPKSGLGYLAQQALFNARVDLILLVALIYGALGLAFDTLVRLVERALTPWNGPKGIR